MNNEDFETHFLVFSVRQWNIIKSALLTAVDHSRKTQTTTSRHLEGYPADTEAWTHLQQQQELMRDLYKIADYISRNIPNDARR